MGRLDIATIRRQQITDAAFKVFSEKGYNSATVADIASELELVHSTVYRYFDNKLDILRSVIDSVIERVARAFTLKPPEAVSSIEGYREALTAIGPALFDLLEEDPELIRFLLFDAMVIDRGITGRINDALALFASYTEEYLKNGIERGFIKPHIRTRETSFAINGMVLEAARQLSSAEEITGEMKSAWGDAIVELILGLETRNSSKEASL